MQNDQMQQQRAFVCLLLLVCGEVKTIAADDDDRQLITVQLRIALPRYTQTAIVILR
jgi:hypothetical protein